MKSKEEEEETKKEKEEAREVEGNGEEWIFVGIHDENV